MGNGLNHSKYNTFVSSAGDEDENSLKIIRNASANDLLYERSVSDVSNVNLGTLEWNYEDDYEAWEKEKNEIKDL